MRLGVMRYKHVHVRVRPMHGSTLTSISTAFAVLVLKPEREWKDGGTCTPYMHGVTAFACMWCVRVCVRACL